MDLQLIGGLGVGTNDIDLQMRVTSLVELHADDEHDTVVHFDSKLSAVGAQRRAGNRMAPESRQAVGDATQLMQRYRSERRAGHGVSCERGPGSGYGDRA